MTSFLNSNTLYQILFSVCFVGIFGYIAVLTIVNFVLTVSFKQRVTVKVIDKSPVGTKVGGRYLITIEVEGQTETIANATSIVWSKLKIDEMQSRVQIGQTQDFEVVGKRIPILGTYRNILKIY